MSSFSPLTLASTVGLIDFFFSNVLNYILYLEKDDVQTQTFGV